MVVHDARGVKPGKFAEVDFAVSECIAWAGKAAVEQALVPNACFSAMLSENVFVKDEYSFGIEPEWLGHLASSRSALR